MRQISLINFIDSLAGVLEDEMHPETYLFLLVGTKYTLLPLMRPILLIRQQMGVHASEITMLIGLPRLTSIHYVNMEEERRLRRIINSRWE